MKQAYWIGGVKGNTARKILLQKLKEYGIDVCTDHEIFERDRPIICWGHSSIIKPNLNGYVNASNKYEAMIRFVKAGINVPPVFDANPFQVRTQRKIYPFPWLGRKVYHREGNDIVPVKDTDDAYDQIGKSDFFSVFIPTAKEFRIWVFQGEAFAAYRKDFKGIGEYEGFQRNHDFGFHFEKVDELLTYKKLTTPSIAAVAALKLDFGAVDILEGKDGKFYVLEVNSMPHIDSSKRSSGIRLAKRIAAWVEKQ
jgi:glutathione synthase/RimK-type ligase-like ATP-grasp enzyme